MAANTQKESGNYLEHYVNDIFHKLQEIDLYLKINGDKLSIEETSELLALDISEIKEIMGENGFTNLSKKAFLAVMEKGGSEICQLFKREIECDSPYIYSRNQIAYIYNLKIDMVNKICDKLSIKEITPYTLPMIFANIN